MSVFRTKSAQVLHCCWFSFDCMHSFSLLQGTVRVHMHTGTLLMLLLLLLLVRRFFNVKTFFFLLSSSSLFSFFRIICHCVCVWARILDLLFIHHFKKSKYILCGSCSVCVFSSYTLQIHFWPFWNAFWREKKKVSLNCTGLLLIIRCVVYNWINFVFFFQIRKNK